jgi:DNA uptake protein ComE-like DNA-binding protein
LQRWKKFLQSPLWWPASFLALAAVAGLLTLAVRPASDVSSLQFFGPNERPTPIVLAPAAPRTIDLNNASQAELETLPGVGAGRALAIIEARREGPIRSLDDAVRRDLLTRAVAADLRDLVSIESAVAEP